LEATLWHGNGTDTGGGPTIATGAVNIYGDPAFVDPAAWDYHLTGYSAAIDEHLVNLSSHKRKAEGRQGVMTGAKARFSKG
jgi:hypothetical protein